MATPVLPDTTQKMRVVSGVLKTHQPTGWACLCGDWKYYSHGNEHRRIGFADLHRAHLTAAIVVALDHLAGGTGT